MTSATTLRVPYITAYDEELPDLQLMLVPDAGTTQRVRLGFVGAVEQDWNQGVLWYRAGLHRRGKPEWRLVNTLRQRRCMSQLLCQVCGGTAVMRDGRISWLLAAPAERSAAGVQFTSAPPTCESCIPEALATCPRLGAGMVCSVQAAHPYGVRGDLMKVTGSGLVTAAADHFATLDAYRQLEFMLAKQLVVALEDLRSVAA